MKHIFILNTFTLKEETTKMETKIINYCKKNKIDYTIEKNTKKLSTEDIALKYKDTKNIIIAVGGDGVINRVLNVIANTDNILGFIPTGTGNDFYRTAKLVFQDKFNKCDLVKINNKYFINTACFGIDADVANNKNIVKTNLIPKKQKYNLSLVYNFFKYKCRHFIVKVNNEKIEDNFTTIALCNGCYYGRGFNIGPSSSLQDGKFEVYLAPKLNKLSMIKLILKMKKGKHEDSKHIKKFTTTKLSITSPTKIKANIDGEELYDNEFNIKLIKEGITIYYNQELLDYLLAK